MHARRWSNRILIVVFIAGTASIGVFSLLGPSDRESLAREGRSPAPVPSLRDTEDLKKLPGRFDAFFNDRLALREPMLNLHARIKVEALGVSSSDKVILGRDGWLFYDERSEDQGNALSWGDQRFRWYHELAHRQRWLEQRGILYVMALTPEKHTIYAEFLPASHSVPKPRMANELATMWRCFHRSPISMLELGEAHRKQKSQQRLYFQTDSHWNDDGAYLGYRELMEHLATSRKAMRPIDRAQFDAIPVTGFVGDLARMLHLPAPPSEDIVELRLRYPKARRFEIDVPLNPALRLPHLTPQAWGTGNPALPRGIIFHDSFAERLWLPLLAEHFELLIYAPTDSFDPALVEHFRPHIVIQQIVERKINQHLPRAMGK